MRYLHSAITINGREVKLTDILSENSRALTGFEADTFLCIKNWVKGEEIFTLQTSGSTGKPKEILLHRSYLEKSAERTLKILSLTHDDTALVCLDTRFIAGKMMLVRALEGNMKIVAIEPSNLQQDFRFNTPSTFTAVVPLQLSGLLKNSNGYKVLNQFKVILVGGASVNEALKREIEKLSCTVYQTYGMTETVSHIALQQLNGNGASEYFRTLNGIQVTLDERGCLTIRIPEFAEPIVTNDLVEIISASSFRWLGRLDNVINSGGFKISPEKIEELVENLFIQLNVKRSFFVCGIPDEQFGQKLILVIEGFPISGERKISEAFKQHLHPYEVPKQILYIRKFIYTETRKINRQKTTALITNRVG